MGSIARHRHVFRATKPDTTSGAPIQGNEVRRLRRSSTTLNNPGNFCLRTARRLGSRIAAVQPRFCNPIKNCTESVSSRGDVLHRLRTAVTTLAFPLVFLVPIPAAVVVNLIGGVGIPVLLAFQGHMPGSS